MQGDIFEDVPILRWDTDDDGLTITNYEPSRLKFAIVLSQECDLDQDFRNWSDLTRSDLTRKNQDKFLHSVLVCPAYPSGKFGLGIHLGSIKMSNLKDAGHCTQIKQNNHERYHFLKGSTEKDKKNGIHVPSLVVDFKHYHTLPVEVVYKLNNDKHYIGSVNELFREEVSRRFSVYLSRIGLPPVEPPRCD